MKRSVEWHEQCLKNQREHVQRKREELARMAADVERISSSVDFLQRQIDEAKKLGKDGFDEDKFLKKERPAR